jgi:ribosome-associated protein
MSRSDTSQGRHGQRQNRDRNGNVLVVDQRVRVPLRELTFDFVRSAGPGGQNVNKVSSKAVVRWPVTTSPSLPPEIRERFVLRFGKRITRSGEVVIASQRFRSRARNLDDCLQKLCGMLAAAARAPVPRRATVAAPAARARRVAEKRARGETKRGRGPVRPDGE